TSLHFPPIDTHSSRSPIFPYTTLFRSVSMKVVSVNPRNRDGSLPSTSATIYVFDSKTGSELARIAGDNLTAIRTAAGSALATDRSEEHTSELQSRFDLVCRLLLEKKKT